MELAESDLCGRRQIKIRSAFQRENVTCKAQPAINMDGVVTGQLRRNRRII
jgi:hypothetical protein